MEAYLSQGDEFQLRILELSNRAPTSVTLLDPFWLVQRQRVSLVRDSNLQDRLDQSGLVDMPADQLKIASYLLGQDYSAVRLAELEATDDEAFLEELVPEAGVVRAAFEFRPEVVPYFEVERVGGTFTSLQLSQGELAGLTVVWALAQVDPNSLTLIDEPETFLSPDASRRALDVVAHYTDRRKSPCIVASHSHLGLAEAPIEHVLLLVPSLTGESRLEHATAESLWTSLKLKPPHAIIFVVEDQAAAEWLVFLLRKIDFPHVESSAVWRAGGAGEVRTAARFPRCPDADIAIWGVLDGDERVTGGGGQLLFLPGDEAPEGTIVNFLSAFPDQELGFHADRVEQALTLSAGQDPHDRVDSIAHHLGLAVASLRIKVLDAWLATDAGTAALERFKAELAEVRPVYADA
jgi:hypothetical protein